MITTELYLVQPEAALPEMRTTTGTRPHTQQPGRGTSAHANGRDVGSGEGFPSPSQPDRFLVS
jgi:hypothetical protein